MRTINRPKSLLNKSNIPDSVPELSFGFTRNNVYKCIRYYYKNFTNIDVLDYSISSKNIKTNAVLKNGDIEDIVDTNSGYSNYDLDIMEHIGYDMSEFWNGNSVIIYFDNNNRMKIMNSDYYSNKMMKGLLYCESANALDDVNCDLENLEKSHFSLRNSLLSSKDQFLKSDYVKGGSSGGIIFGRKNGEWNFILGKRSQDVGVNKGYYSIIPNGSIEYEEFKNDMRFINTTKREFNEETGVSDGFFDNHVDYERVFTGFNIVSGGFTTGHALFIDDEEKFDMVRNNGAENFEFERIETINVNDLSKIKDVIQYSKVSPSVIPIIMNGLMKFNKKNDLPSLDYQIERT